MCELCNNPSVTKMLKKLASAIRRSGFVVVSVADEPAWAYTVGLLDSADHPEVVVAGAPLAPAERILDEIASLALGGERFGPGDTIDLGEERVAQVGPVHPIHFELETFAVWQALADMGAIHRHHPHAVQVLMPPECRQGMRLPQPVLANPAARVGTGPRPNRHERRARQRRR